MKQAACAFQVQSSATNQLFLGGIVHACRWCWRDLSIVSNSRLELIQQACDESHGGACQVGILSRRELFQLTPYKAQSSRHHPIKESLNVFASTGAQCLGQGLQCDSTGCGMCGVTYLTCWCYYKVPLQASTCSACNGCMHSSVVHSNCPTKPQQLQALPCLLCESEMHGRYCVLTEPLKTRKLVLTCSHDVINGFHPS